jgi:flagellar hook-associated protein 1 FlgK
MSISYNGLTGALAAQAALNTSSQNVANLQTKGYTRQGVLLSAVQPDAGGHQPGPPRRGTGRRRGFAY